MTSQNTVDVIAAAATTAAVTNTTTTITTTTVTTLPPRIRSTTRQQKKREIVLDTETTGFEPRKGHRIVEIGALEMIDGVLTGRAFHTYINPERNVPLEAYRVHGLSDAFLKDRPPFRDVAEAFLKFVADSRLVIHHAPFDLKFLNYELSLLKKEDIKRLQLTNTTDTLVLARWMFPGLRCDLDALCRRLNVDNSGRQVHGALKDALLLAKVYMKMMDVMRNH